MSFSFFPVLQPPAAHLYPYTVALWRAADLELDGNGRPVIQGSGSLLDWGDAPYVASQACYIEATPYLTQPAVFLQMEDDNLLTTDRFHFPAAADVRTFDVAIILTYPLPALVGVAYELRGNAEDHNFFSGKRVLRAKQVIKPKGIP